jgi:hypothetical protein
MRSSKLIPALAAASALLVLAPAGAAARPAGQKHASASPNGRCRVGLIAEPRTITAGEPVELFGQLLCAKGTNVGQTLTVYERTAGSSIFKVVGTAVTGAEGLYKFTPPTVTVDSWFDVRSPTGRSGNHAVKVAPAVKLKGPEPESVPLETGAKHKVTFTGTVNPADVGAEVLLERQLTGTIEEWGAIQKGIVGPGGVYSFTHTFALPGPATLRAIVRPHGTFTVRGISNTLSYVINQVQNPNLTIKSTANPISFGAPITIEGVLKGGAGKTITLMSHKKGSKTFTPVTTAVAGPSGEYKFVQTPPTTTFYQATGGGLKSAILVEGVKYLLTAGVTPKAPTIQSGQKLTFAGTVAPIHTGTVVYLERENAFGGGFHVADAGVVTAGGTYTIEHTVWGASRAVFRIKVPGDNENQPVSSELFKVEVTPAPPGVLHPVAPRKGPR